MNEDTNGDPGNDSSHFREAVNSYFSMEPGKPSLWDEREMASLQSLLGEIATWDREESGGRNIFLIGSYEGVRRSMASAYLALHLHEMGRKVILLKSTYDTGTGSIDSANPPVAFLNYSRQPSMSEQHLLKLIRALGRRRVKRIPVVVSIPDEYMELFQANEEESYKVSYPHNNVSRAFFMFAAAIMLSPLLEYPLMYIPLGNSTALNDAGAVITGLFIYGLILLFIVRRKIDRGHTVPMAVAVVLGILSGIILPGFFTPVLMVVALGIFPYGFVPARDHRILLYSILASIGITAAEAFRPVSALILSSFPSQTLHYGNTILASTSLSPLSFTGLAAVVASVPASAIFFIVYLGIGNYHKNPESIMERA